MIGWVGVCVCKGGRGLGTTRRKRDKAIKGTGIGSVQGIGAQRQGGKMKNERGMDLKEGTDVRRRRWHGPPLVEARRIDIVDDILKG